MLKSYAGIPSSPHTSAGLAMYVISSQLFIANALVQSEFSTFRVLIYKRKGILKGIVSPPIPTTHPSRGTSRLQSIYTITVDDIYIASHMHFNFINSPICFDCVCPAVELVPEVDANFNDTRS